MMTESCEGAYNLTAPEPVMQKHYAKTLGKVLLRPWFAPAPGFVLRSCLENWRKRSFWTASVRSPSACWTAASSFLTKVLSRACVNASASKKSA